MPRLILVRHGLTDWNKTHRYQGQTDTDLNATGREQARATADRLVNEPISVAISSDLQRASETAAIIAAPHGISVQPDPRLRELNLGQWEGLTFEEVKSRFPEEWLSVSTGRAYLSPAGGEPLESVVTRIESALADLYAYPDGQTVLLVAHGGSLRCLLCQALGVNPHKLWQFRFGSCTVTELILEKGRAMLTLFNDGHHLPS